jgi:hypothetical protein
MIHHQAATESTKLLDGRFYPPPVELAAAWHRWITLAMLAHAFLAVATAIERHAQPAPAGLTVNEFRRLFDAPQLGGHPTPTTLLSWSD